MARGEGGGRPKKIIDPIQVRELARIQCTLEEMAAVLRCSISTLQRRFDHVIKEGREEGKTSLRRGLFKMATHEKRPNLGALIWLSKQHLGMSDKVDQKQDVQVEEVIVLQARLANAQDANT